MIFINRFDMFLSFVYGYYLIHGTVYIKPGEHEPEATMKELMPSGYKNALELKRATYMLVEVGALHIFAKRDRRGANIYKMYRISAIGYMYAIKNNFYKDQNQNSLNLSSIITDDPQYVNKYILDKFNIIDFQKYAKENEDPANSSRIVGLNYNI